MLVTTHYMDEAEYCDRISIMVAGRIGAMDHRPSSAQFNTDVDRRGLRAARPAGDSGARMNSLWGLLRKEVYHILRDRRTLAVIVLMPVVQVILFGFAIRTDVKDVRVAIVDPRPDHVTLEIRQRLEASEAFRTVAVVGRMEELDGLFQRGSAQEAVVFEPDFAQRLDRGFRPEIQIITDAIEPNTASTRQNYTLSVIQAYERAAPVTPGHHHRAAGADAVQSDLRKLPSLRARPHGLRLTIISALMTAISLTREKETGTMETLLVSPLRPWQIIAGKWCPTWPSGLSVSCW